MTDAREAASRRHVTRLLKRVGITDREIPTADNWAAFLEASVALLADFEQDRYLLEQSLEASSNEMMELNAELRAVAERLAREREELRASNSVLAATLESTADGILVVDNEGRITSFNGRFAEMWRLPESVLQTRDDGNAMRFVLEQVEDPDAFVAKIKELYATPEAASHDEVLFKDGRVFERDSLPQQLDGEIIGRVWNFSDVTEQRRLQAELQHLAFHDPLTDLTNRAVFGDHVVQALRRSARMGGYVAVTVVDLDGFKHVNDSLGHQVGDALLISIADRFREKLRDFDVVARLGGDEFAMMVDGLEFPEQAARLGQRILDALKDPVQLGDREVVVGASVGIALAHESTTNAEELLGHADAAMYRAKREGKNCYRIFEDSMHAFVVDRLNLEQELRRAATNKALSVQYQPVVNALTGRVTSFEALARWNDPERGFVPPDVFIPLAEETGLIIEIGRSVLTEACRQAAFWARLFPGLQLTMAVNVSGRQLAVPGYVADVESVLEETGLDPSLLTLEITESIIMADTTRVVGALDRLRRLGIRIAIDDFGTGYSSLATLSELPVDTLKIDKRFIDHLNQDNRGRGLVNAILGIAQTLELTTIAEGVETAAQLQSLIELGCQRIQGYLFARPMVAEEAYTYLEHQSRALEHCNELPRAVNG